MIKNDQKRSKTITTWAISDIGGIDGPNKKEKSMSYQNYSLEIISKHPKFSGKTLRKYHVNGIDTVGAFCDEPFEIRFTSYTPQKCQVVISLDGTNVLTGKPASTEVSKDMWVVNGYGSMTLKAWPEDHGGGASFIFTSAN